MASVFDNRHRIRWHYLAAVVISLLCRTAYAAGVDQTEINVNVGFSDAGRKIAPPAPGHPIYYFPVVLGYREEGARVNGEKAPPTKPIIHQIAKALAKQGYFVISEKNPTPSLLLTIAWGYMNPDLDEAADGSGSVLYNQREMLALVGGETLRNLDLLFEREAVLDGARENRYFVVVSAFDFAAVQKKKKVLLWQARMSTPSAGVTLDEVLPSLIAAGTPLFGHETLRPKWVQMPVARDGRVDIGEPQTIEYTDAPKQPASAPVPPKAEAKK